MSVKVEKLEKNLVKLEITIEAEKFEEGLQKAFFRNAKYFSVPGFRKGKAPRNIVERHYGESILYEDAFNIVAPEAYEAAISENKIDPVASPEIDITQIEKGKDIVFTALVTVKPEVELGEYKGIKVDKKEYKVTAKEVNEKLKEMAEKNSRIVAGDENSIIENGDTAVINFEGFVDDKPFEGGSGENYPLEIGSNTFIPGFEEQLIGLKINEETEVKVAFPENYFSKDLAGKPAVFKVKINEIKVKELPEIDDEFAKDVSEFDTLKELKDDTKKKLEEENAKKAKYETEEEAIKQVVEASKVEIPQVMVDNEVEDYLKQMESSFLSQGMNLETYMQLMGKSVEDLKEQYQEEAMQNVRKKLVLEKIYKEEKIEISDEDINNKLLEISKKYGNSQENAEKFVKEASEQIKEYLKEELKYDMAVKFIMDNAQMKKDK